MPRKPVGQIFVRDYGGPKDVYALRFRADGKRRYVTLGKREEGWNDQRARDELDRVLKRVKEGTWAAKESRLEALIRDVLKDADHDALNDLDELAWRVLDVAKEEVLKEELHGFLRRLISATMGESVRKVAKKGHVAELDLDDVVRPAGDRKRIGDCTVADVETLAYEAELKAQQLLDRAGQWRSLAGVMRAKQAKTVRQLGATAATDAMRRGRMYKVTRNDELAA